MIRLGSKEHKEIIKKISKSKGNQKGEFEESVPLHFKTASLKGKTDICL